MNYLIYTVVFVIALVVLSTLFEYWQSRKQGLTHDASLHESAVAGTFLSSSAVFGYIVALVV
ncbi:MAG: hypothetical protein GC139_00180 [Sideroxydans sp.]|nr:hypothetical protein [Sideroxydans sp.]